MRFSISEIGSKFISSIVDYYTRPPAPLENDASTSLKFRPARVITKARFKSDMEIGDKKLEEGMQLLVSNEYLVSKKEMDVLLLSRDKYALYFFIIWSLNAFNHFTRIQKRKAAIMEACNAKFISPKVHLSPFIYNSRASQWYRQVEVIKSTFIFMSLGCLTAGCRNLSTDKRYTLYRMTTSRCVSQYQSCVWYLPRTHNENRSWWTKPKCRNCQCTPTVFSW